MRALQATSRPTTVAKIAPKPVQQGRIPKVEHRSALFVSLERLRLLLPLRAAPLALLVLLRTEPSRRFALRALLTRTRSREPKTSAL